MRRDITLLEKRSEFIKNYVQENKEKQMKVIVNELVERLFISERTIYNTIAQ